MISTLNHAALAGLIHDQSKKWQSKDILADLKRLGRKLPEETAIPRHLAWVSCGRYR